MNPNSPQQPWTRLTAAARTARDERDATAPYGFATRVVALAFEPKRDVASLVERLGLRAVFVSSLLALLSVVANYSVFNSIATAPIEEEVGEDDPVTLLLGD